MFSKKEFSEYSMWDYTPYGEKFEAKKNAEEAKLRDKRNNRLTILGIVLMVVIGAIQILVPIYWGK